MGWGTAFAAGYILGGISGLAVFAVMFGTRREGKAVAEADHQRRQNEAIIADQERADDIAKRAEEAAAAPRIEPAAVRLRRAGRLRETGK
jgi:hypothetical protein